MVALAPVWYLFQEVLVLAAEPRFHGEALRWYVVCAMHGGGLHYMVRIHSVQKRKRLLAKL